MLDENWVTSTIAGVQGRNSYNNIIDGTTVTVNGDDEKKKQGSEKKLKNTALIGSGVTVGLLNTTKDIIGHYGWQQSNSKLFDLGLNFSAESAHFEKLLAKMKALGYLGFFGSTGIKGYDLLNNYSDQKLLDYSINTFYGGLMVFCSTPGFIVGVPHFLVDEIVGWKNIWLLDNQMLMK